MSKLRKRDLSPREVKRIFRELLGLSDKVAALRQLQKYLWEEVDE